MLKSIRKWFLPTLALAAVIFATHSVLEAQRQPPKAVPPVAPPESPFGNTVAGSGIAEPRTENISIGSHVPGVAAEVFVQVGQKVAKGTPLFRIDDRQMRADLLVREARLESAIADLKRLQSMPRPEQIPPSEAKVREAKANLDEQEDLLARSVKLVGSRSIGQEEYIRRQQEHHAAKARFAQASAEHALLLAGAWDSDKAVAQAAVDHARAQVEQMRIEIDRLVVRASVDGDILQVNVRPGEFCGAPPSQTLILLGDVRNLHVRVDIDEHDIPRFRLGLPARASVRGHHDTSFPLRFVRVEPYVVPKKSLTGDNSERVDTRVLQAIYAFEKLPANVFVGQQLDVFIDITGHSPEGSVDRLVQR